MASEKQHVVIGMAGHIDHGKTALVKALTGTNTDRLKEEKERGMTTDLGFAFMGQDITLIDVPGHEKFVKTMVAGVTTVDMALFVIAADDGVMPQSIEHLEILNLLNVKHAIIVLNKIDIVDEEWAELVTADINELLKGTSLENAPIVPVSALSGIGIDHLKEEIASMANRIPPRQDNGLFRLFVDRVFTIKGFGTVVAGTVLSGVIHPEDILEIQPQGITTRVRGIQVHGKKVGESCIGQRAAINLTAEKEDITRGDVLVEPGFAHPTSMIDCNLSLLSSAPRALKNRDRVRVHIGTSEVMARAGMIGRENLELGETGFVQLRFEKPVVGERGDRFVIRSYSPIQTIGGGEFIDNNPKKHKMSDTDALEYVEQLYEGNPEQVLLDHFDRYRFTPLAIEELTKALSLQKDACTAQLENLIELSQVTLIGKKRYVSMKNYSALKAKTVLLLKNYLAKNRLRNSMSSALLKSSIKVPVDANLFKAVLQALAEEGTCSLKGDLITLKGHRIELSAAEQALSEAILHSYKEAFLSPPTTGEIAKEYGADAEALLVYLMEIGDLVKLDENTLLYKAHLLTALTQIVELFKDGDTRGISAFREHFKSLSRKHTMALLEYADKIQLTARSAEVRVLKNSAVLEDLRQ